jgi:hypothetical protein
MKWSTRRLSYAKHLVLVSQKLIVSSFYIWCTSIWPLVWVQSIHRHIASDTIGDICRTQSLASRCLVSRIADICIPLRLLFQTYLFRRLCLRRQYLCLIFCRLVLVSLRPSLYEVFLEVAILFLMYEWAINQSRDCIN